MTPEAERLYKLSELAAELGVEAGVLKFWEKEFSRFIEPLKAGPRKKLYRPEDLETFRSVKRLLYEDGLALAEVRRALAALKEPGGEGLAGGQSAEPAGELETLRELLAEIRRELLALRRLLTASGPKPPSKTADSAPLIKSPQIKRKTGRP